VTQGVRTQGDARKRKCSQVVTQGVRTQGNASVRKW